MRVRGNGRDADEAGGSFARRRGAGHAVRRRGESSRPGPGRTRSKLRRRLAAALYILAAVVSVLTLVAAVGGYAYVRRLEGNITKVKVGDLSGKTVYGALNILVLGSQERAGQKGFFGYEADPQVTNSDNLLLVHLDPTHTHATILSIPRDLFVYEPGCQARPQTGSGIWGPYDYPPGALIDGALNIGGPTCAVKTVEDLTGVPLDHFVEFDFNSFRTMVDELGGVEVCVPPGPGYHDGYSHLNLSPGLHLLKYNQALAYVRTRHGVGSGTDAGGDLPRIELQQAFISSVVQKVNSSGLMSNVPRLLRIAGTATRALTVDDNLGSVTSLVSLARSLAHLPSRNVSLVTLPTATDTYDYPQYTAHLMAVQPQDDVLYEMIRTGQQWHGRLPVVADSKVAVQVLNGTGDPGLAARTAASLRKLGFNVIGTGDVPAAAATEVSYAGLARADDAYTLMTALSQFPAAQDTLAAPASLAGVPGPITLTLGAGFAGVAKPVTTRPKHGKDSTSIVSAAAPSVQSRNAGASICSGLPPAYTPGAQGPP
jgi:LCP family protein required for cell wall assembly